MYASAVLYRVCGEQPVTVRSSLLCELHTSLYEISYGIQQRCLSGGVRGREAAQETHAEGECIQCRFFLTIFSRSADSSEALSALIDFCQQAH